MATGLGIGRIGNVPRDVRIAAILVDPRVQAPRTDAEGHPVAGLTYGHRLIVRKLRRMEDFAAGNQQRGGPRECEAGLDEGLPPVRGRDRALGRQLQTADGVTRTTGIGDLGCLVQCLQQSWRIGGEVGRHRRELVSVLGRLAIVDGRQRAGAAPL